MTLTRQNEVLSQIAEWAKQNQKTGIARQRACANLLIGAIIALGQSEVPPHWVINVQCGRTDRLFTELPAK